MDPFAAIMLGGTALLVIALMLIGAFHPRSGADVLRWRPTRSPEVEAQNEIDDVDQMLAPAAAPGARARERTLRRPTGRPPRTRPPPCPRPARAHARRRRGLDPRP